MSAGAYGTTYQATDFKDIEGDRILGRKTIPIVAPVLSRPTLMALICISSSCLAGVWKLRTLYALALNAYSLFVGARFVICRTVVDDMQSLIYHMSDELGPGTQIWLSILHVLPAYGRLFVTAFAEM